MKRISDEDMEKLPKIKKQLASIRENRETAWERMARFVDPNHRYFNEESPDTSRKDDYGEIYDATAIKAANLLADGMQGYSFARNQAWFTLKEEGKDGTEELNRWLGASEQVMYNVLQASNFYQEGREFVKLVSLYGTGVMIHYFDDKRIQPVYRTLGPNEYWVEENDAGEIDALVRVVWFTPSQAQDTFGSTCPKAIIEQNKQGNLKPFKFYQFIFPPGKWGIKVKIPKGYRYFSVYYAETEVKTPLLETIYEYKPFFCWRWNRTPGESYGVDSPGQIAYPEIKTLNHMRKHRLLLSGTMAEPPIKATEGLAGAINYAPRGITYLRRGQDFNPMNVVGNLGAFDGDIQQLTKSINDTFQTDLFLILSQNIEREKTATEVSGIQGEKAALMASFYGRLVNEFLEPAVESLFNYCLRADLLPQRDEGISADIRIDMVSPLAQMQKGYMLLSGSQQAYAEVLPLAKFNPAILDNINFDRHIRNVFEARGVDERELRLEAEVEQLRKARAQQQQAMMTQQQQQQLGESLVNATRAGVPGAGEAGAQMINQITGGSPA
jgi:hypothetical protein